MASPMPRAPPVTNTCLPMNRLLISLIPSVTFYGGVFQFVDNELMSREELVRLYTVKREPRLQVTRIPLKLACFLAGGLEWLANLVIRPAPISPYRLRSAVAPLVFDCTKAREQLGWQPGGHTRETLRK